MTPLLAAVLSLVPLLDDRPPADDLLRFPPAHVIEEQLLMNRRYREYMESRIMIELHHAWTIHVAMMETDVLHDTWNTLRWAHFHGDPGGRRDVLRLLRDRLGPDAYYAGRMPPPVPLHRFVTNP